MTPVPIKNNLFVQIEQALVDEISTESGFKLYLAPEWNFEENATVTGKITHLPKDFQGDLSIGDNVAFSYHVVSDRTFPNTSNWFVPIAEPSGSLKLWQNGKGEKLRMMAHQGAISVFWTGTYFNSKGQFEYGTQGTENQVERWMGQNFTFGNCEKFVFKNKLPIDNKEYWKCNYENVFAKKVGDEIVAVGDRVICSFIDVPANEIIKELKGIIIPDHTVEFRLYDRARVISGGSGIGLVPGDVVSFNKDYCEKYKLFGKDYFLIKEKRIEGIWENKQTA